ncbi:MAG: iron-containing alcohol dehydrogenase [Candidatus Micrarchaeota archaeon]
MGKGADKIIDGANPFFALIPRAYLPRAVFFKRDVHKVLGELSGDSNLIIASKSALADSKTKALLETSLSSCKNEYWQVSGEPTEERLAELKEKLSRANYDNVIGVGGGSVMDLAKCAKLSSSASTIMIPTTPGTGSEATPYSLFINAQKQKTIVRSGKLLPDIVILEPQLLASLPHQTLAYSSLDGLSHSLEALVSRVSNPLADSFALQGIALSFEAWKDESLSLEKVQLAGFFGGLAINAASVALIHGFAHNFTRFNVDHGRAISLVLADLAEFNLSKGVSYSKLDSIGINSKELPAKIRGLIKSMDVALEKPSISSSELPALISAIKSDRCTRSNPCAPSDEEITAILKKTINVI